MTVTLVSQPRQGPIHQAQLTKGKEKDVSTNLKKKYIYIYSTMKTEDSEALERQRAKPSNKDQSP